MSLTPGNWLSRQKLSVLFVRDMGNYRQNRVDLASVLVKLRNHTAGVQYTGYHWRPSGNFLFLHESDKVLPLARAVGEEVTKLPCLVRAAAELEALVHSMPKNCEETPQGSVILKIPQGVRKVIWVGVSHPIAEDELMVGPISARCSIFNWPSQADVLCLYDRPKQGGDVGQVTTAFMRTIERKGDLFATGRSMGLLRDLTLGKGIIQAT